jgi:hypothetical protein
LADAAPGLHTTDLVPRSPALVFVALALTFITGCAHQHRVGYPPSEAEIGEINRAGGGQVIAVQYVDPLAVCVGGACSVSGATVVPAGPPAEIERIVSADSHQLTVVSTSGERWTLPADGVLAVTTRGHATGQGALIGGLLALPVGGLVALFAATGPILDPSVDSYDRHPASTSTAVGILVGVTAVGAIIGAIVGYNTLTFETYELGHTGRFADPSILSR